MGIAKAAIRLNRWVHTFEPWGIFLTFIGLLVALIGLMIDLEDRQSERIFRAWGVVLSVTTTPLNASSDTQIAASAGSSVRQALQYLNRDFTGRGCFGWVAFLSEFLTGNNARGCIFPEKDRESLRNLSIPHAVLEDIELSHAELSGAILRKVDLYGAKLQHADLENALLHDAKLGGADLRNAELRNAKLPKADLHGAKLQKATLLNADLREADLRGADLQHADLGSAKLCKAKLNNADLQDADLLGADLREARGIDCRQLRTAKNWEQSIRGPQLECGKILE